VSADPFAPGLLGRLPAPPRSVVLVRPSRLGDFLCATPAFRALRAALPEARITIVTLPLLRELATRLPYFDEYVAFPGFPGIAEQLFDAQRALAFFTAMQARRFDLAIQMYESGLYSNPFTLMLGAQHTAGFVRSSDRADLLDAALPIPRTGHEVHRVLALAEFLGAPPRGHQTEWPARAEDDAVAEALIGAEARPLIGLHPGAQEPGRRWNPRRLGRAGAELWRQQGGTLIVLGGRNDVRLAEVAANEIDEATGNAAPCRNFAAGTPLAAFAALVARLDLLIGNDSGPAHVAYAVGTPCLVIHDGSQVERYGPPPGGRHAGVIGSDLNDVKVADVVQAANALLNR
jgi:ADP-heptose:LPS heptosyltransferase